MIYKREEYVEENPEDKKFPVKHIDVATPIDGNRRRFVGEVALGVQTPLGIQQIPITFEIPADTVEQAFQRFEQYAAPKVEEARRQIEEEFRKIRKEATSRIVRPGDLNLRGQGNVIDISKLKQ
jgi:hypothetical protein